MAEIKFWEDKDRRTIDPHLFSNQAENLAKQFAEDNRSNRKANRRTQIRKFYDEVQRLNALARHGQEDWENIIPYVHMLVAKASYARGRELVSDRFVGFIRSSINQIQDPEGLAVFSNFFEALMGFYRQYGPAN